MKTYGPGEPIISIAQFEFARKNGLLLFVAAWDKTAHPIILANMQYRVVKGFIDNGYVFLAKKLCGERS
jgi:hypothetical protein